MRRAAVAALCAAALLGVAAPARASSVTGASVRALAARAAAGDADALNELRAVTEVDGRPADLAGALGAAGGAELRARLGTLAAVAGSRPGGDTLAPGQAQAQAQAIIDAGQRTGAALRDPVSRLLIDLGNALAKLVGRFPGGAVVFWVVAAAVVLGLAARTARRMLARRAPAAAQRRGPGRLASEDPAALERAADEAERAGAYEQAVRLRFRAGLLRVGAEAYRPSLRTAEVARRLRSPVFDSLAVTFDRVAYGGGRASAQDAEAARERWPLVLQDAA